MPDKEQETRTVATLLACCQAAQEGRIPWWQIARAVQRAGSVDTLVEGPWDPVDRWEFEAAAVLQAHFRHDEIDRWAAALHGWADQEPALRWLTVLDPEYPASLRLVFNQPPFITLLGEIREDDARGVAIVGTRKPTPDGTRRAHKLAFELASDGITIYSGLARGIDAAAHAGALEARGRTIAVLGHGLLQPVYPKENAALAERVRASGGLVSQFRPDAPPTRWSFGMRNAITSGLSQGTVVVEASHTSGARMQARFAAEQGKRVWLLRSLVRNFQWARDFTDRYPAETRVVEQVSDVVEELVDRPGRLVEPPPVPEAEERRRPRRDDDQQLTLALR